MRKPQKTGTPRHPGLRKKPPASSSDRQQIDELVAEYLADGGAASRPTELGESTPAQERDRRGKLKEDIAVGRVVAANRSTRNQSKRGRNPKH
jgi:hypothetical protein